MAYILKTIGESANAPIKHFECDDVDDLYLIDTADVLMGSTCYVIHTNTLYTLNSNKEWQLSNRKTGVADAVRFGLAQNLTEEQKAQARENIGATKANSDMETLVMLAETDMLPAVHNEDNKLLTDENGQIILRYYGGKNERF